jgi:hypothetical protein
MAHNHRLHVLQQHLVPCSDRRDRGWPAPAPVDAPAQVLSEGQSDPHLRPGFHWIGEMSKIAANHVPAERWGPTNPALLDPSLGTGGFARTIALDTDALRDRLTSDGTPWRLYPLSGAASRGWQVRLAAAGDDILRMTGLAVAVADAAAARAIKLVDSTPARKVARESAQMLHREALNTTEAITGAVLAANLSSELVADHHGGPVHPTSGGWAMVAACGLLHTHAARGWSEMAAVQSVAIACRHIDISRKLGGKVCMPELESGPVGSADPVENLAASILAQHPNRAEVDLQNALKQGATPGRLLGAMLEQGVPRNSTDDHYFLYPLFASMTLSAIGWEYAEVVLRPVVRFLATHPPWMAASPSAMPDFKGNGSPGLGEWRWVQEISESQGLAASPPARGGRDEVDWAQKAQDFADEWTGVESLGAAPFHMGDAGSGRNQALFRTVIEPLAASMSATAASRMSLHTAMAALSMCAARLYLRSDIGNPMDVHMLTGVGARRHMLSMKDVPLRLQTLGLLMWGAGFEIRYHDRDGYGVEAIERSGRALKRSGRFAEGVRAQELLDAISAAMVSERDPEHFRMAHELYSNDTPQAPYADFEAQAAHTVWPLVWLYGDCGGDVDAFFSRMFQHTAMDDYSEMHVFKIVACCHEECRELPRAISWWYMCAAAKAVCNTLGTGRMVFDAAAGPLFLDSFPGGRPPRASSEFKEGL